jgi:hypothetical protein
LASLGVSLEGRGSSQGDSVDLEPRHCVSEDTLSELDLAHASKCVLGRQQGHVLVVECMRTTTSPGRPVPAKTQENGQSISGGAITLYP